MIGRFKISKKMQEINEDSVNQSDQSVDVLVSKNHLPPPLMLLPKQSHRNAKSLLPMMPLPMFIGIIPKFQPLHPEPQEFKIKHPLSFNWIGDAFHNIVYRKYEEQSYMKIDNAQQHWNIYAHDVSKIVNGKSTQQSNLQSPLTQFYTPINSQDSTLIFQSRFQSGNLSLVSKVSEFEYNLLMQNDINTNGYSQWFFFKVCNKKGNSKIKFNILNQYKQNNLYRMGMKIMIYSKRQSQNKNLSWHRGGEEIKYYENGYSRNSQEYRPYFTLSWKYQFLHEQDEVYFAYSYPYTYTNLNNYILKIQSDPHVRHLCQRVSLCKTLAGNNVDVLTITDNNSDESFDKLYVVITARVHPGQSISSYACNGILKFLLSNDERAITLRKYFIFKIIPMINPDGVIHGNYRTNISGQDLNKKWQNPSKIYHPEIYYLKKFILNIKQVGQIVLFCDLHGHSMKKNFFIYGCHDSNYPIKGKQFPLLLSKLFQAFSFKDCSFINKQLQQGTSRTFLTKQLDHCNIYTFQSSFCGPQHENIHYTIKHFEQLGQKFCEALLLYYKDKIKDIQIQAAIKQESYFLNKQQSQDNHSQFEKYFNISQLNYTNFDDCVNSEYSQLSQEQQDYQNLLQDKIIKKFLLMRFMRPGTTMLKRSNIIIRKSQSKDINRIKYKSTFKQSDPYQSESPDKKSTVESSTKKVLQHKIIASYITEKKELRPKLFEAIDIVPMTKGRKRYQSMGKIIYQQQKIVKQPTKPNIKITLNKHYEFGQKQSLQLPEPIFKNNYLKNLNDNKSQKVDFMIKKKFNYPEERNAINLFSSVLSSLRKDKK